MHEAELQPKTRCISARATKGLTPYSLRHGYAWRAAKYYPQPLPLRDTTKLMGHDLKTRIRHYGQWTDDSSTKSAVEASIQSLVEAS